MEIMYVFYPLCRYPEGFFRTFCFYLCCGWAPFRVGEVLVFFPCAPALKGSLAQLILLYESCVGSPL
jgi:hypothetical protein